MSHSNLGRFLRDSVAPVFYFWKIIDVFTYVFAPGAGRNVEAKSFSLFPQNGTQKWQLSISELFLKIPGNHSTVWLLTLVCILAIPSLTNHVEVLMATMLLTCDPQKSTVSFPSQVPSGLLHLAFLLAAKPEGWLLQPKSPSPLLFVEGEDAEESTLPIFNNTVSPTTNMKKFWLKYNTN